MKRLAAAWCLFAFHPACSAHAAELDARFFEAFSARPIGPANMSGRVTDVAVVESRPSTIYVATASAGVWKTVNNGTTWSPLFDKQPVSAIGDVTVAPSNPAIVWVGTGEANPRNSVSWGNGVYQSNDGGKTWFHMGLAETQHISRIVIHPTNPDIVYVAAMGHFWAANPERGIYKTIDGGKSWQLIKFLNEDTGFIDLAMDPSDPDVLYGSAYQVRRDGFSGGNPETQFGDAAGLYKTEDAGKSWARLTEGLPTRPLGRCGIDVYRKDPRIVYAVIQTDQTDIRQVAGQAPKAGNKPDAGGIFRSEDAGKTWTKLNDLCPRPFYYGQIRIDPADDKRLYVLGVRLFISDDGGKTFRDDGASGIHVDHHALWIDPRDRDHLVLGCDGGLNYSYDRGANWESLMNLPLGQFYAIGVDMRKPYRVYGGLQDNGSWGGPSATRSFEGITLADWSRLMGGDGFYCQADPIDADTVYAEIQYCRNLGRFNLATGDYKEIRPQSPKGVTYRFNWNTPFMISPHNPRILYLGGNFVFRSLDRGDHWQTISPDLTRGKPGPSASTGHTLTTLAESPRRPGLLWAGSDDGRIHVSRDGGVKWTDVSDKIPGLPPERWITRIVCSPHADGTAWVTIDRHRNDDRAPYIFRTTDFGATWNSLAGNLPPGGPIHVMRADAQNRDLLFAGTEYGLFTSIDGGQKWHKLGNNPPTVPVHDLVIHPRDRELVIATHGRSIWIMDIAPLQELSAKVLEGKAHLFDIKPATQFQYRRSRGLTGGRFYAAPNPPYGATIHYFLAEASTAPVKLVVVDVLTLTVTELKAPREAGLHTVQWNLARTLNLGPVRVPTPVPPGEYLVRLEVGDQVFTKRVRVEAETPTGGAAAVDED